MIFIFTLILHMSSMSFYHLHPSSLDFVISSFVWLLLQLPKKISFFQIHKCCICIKLCISLSLQSLVQVKDIRIMLYKHLQVMTKFAMWHNGMSISYIITTVCLSVRPTTVPRLNGPAKPSGQSDSSAF
jgi:hypothetical protein